MISVAPLTDSTSLVGNAVALRQRYDEEGVLYLRDVIDRNLMSWAQEKYRAALAAEGLIDLANEAPLWTGKTTKIWRSCDALGTTVWHEVVKQPKLNSIMRDIFDAQPVIGLVPIGNQLAPACRLFGCLARIEIRWKWLACEAAPCIVGRGDSREETSLQFLPVSRHLPDTQGRNDRLKGKHCSVVGNVIDGPERWTKTALPAHLVTHPPGLCIDDAVVCLEISVRTLLSECRQRIVDECRISSLRVIVTDTQARGLAGSKTFDEHIGTLHQLPCLCTSGFS